MPCGIGCRALRVARCVLLRVVCENSAAKAHTACGVKPVPRARAPSRRTRDGLFHAHLHTTTNYCFSAASVQRSKATHLHLCHHTPA